MLILITSVAFLAKTHMDAPLIKRPDAKLFHVSIWSYGLLVMIFPSGGFFNRQIFFSQILAQIEKDLERLVLPVLSLFQSMCSLTFIFFLCFLVYIFLRLFVK